MRQPHPAPGGRGQKRIKENPLRLARVWGAGSARWCVVVVVVCVGGWGGVGSGAGRGVYINSTCASRYIYAAHHRPHIIQYTKLYLYIYILYIIQAVPPCIMQPCSVRSSRSRKQGSDAATRRNACGGPRAAPQRFKLLFPAAARRILSTGLWLCRRRTFRLCLPLQRRAAPQRAPREGGRIRRSTGRLYCLLNMQTCSGLRY